LPVLLLISSITQLTLLLQLLLQLQLLLLQLLLKARGQLGCVESRELPNL
jgi:hypothetical protein